MAPFFYAPMVASPLSVRTQVTNFYGIEECRYSIEMQDTEIGFLSSIKIPCFNWYILYDFFVEPECRNNGYGRRLLAYAIAHAVKSGATRIFVQPGPFERKDEEYVSVVGTERTVRLEQLMKLYQSYGFTRATQGWGRCMIPLLWCLYRMAGINEDPRVLMVLFVKR